MDNDKGMNMSLVTHSKPIIWTIAGADCSGGAGIAADIKTGHALGVEVCHLITANTVQNSQQLVSINPVDVTILQQQVDALIDDKPPAVIKIGLLVNIAQIQWLSQFLQQLKSKDNTVTVVYDPVGQASVGGSFSHFEHNDLTELLTLVDVITPNLHEAQKLADSTSFDLPELAKAIQNKGCNTVIIKGGHSEDEAGSESATEDNIAGESNVKSCTDYCLHQYLDQKRDLKSDQNIVYQLSSPSINTRYSHGGGCSFATALSAFLAHSYLLRDALALTKAFINQGLKSQQGKTNTYGAFEQLTWPDKADNFPIVTSDLNQEYHSLPAFNDLALPRGGIEKLGLYPVIDSLYWLKRLLPLNLNIIQLRLKNSGLKTDGLKNSSMQDIEQLIAEAVTLCKGSKTRLFINDYWQLAIKYNAYGVHIGQEDLQDADLHAIQRAGLRLGISTHGCYEFLLAQQLKPSYLAIGAIFPTKTKNMTGQIQGVKNLQQILTLATDIPVVAIGGINQQNAAQVCQTGCDSIAVVTAITEAENPELATLQLKSEIQGATTEKLPR
jgi:hydroxymethylpyrimidine kinase/phosphomethylpyrimidine kinase/thiamine-phosphate diphosphorylase